MIVVESEKNSRHTVNKEFHKITGGRNRYDLRFFSDPQAIKIRSLISQIYQKEHQKISLVSLANEIGVSNEVLSLVIGGRGGKRPRKELNGMSSTDFILSRLKQFTEVNSH